VGDISAASNGAVLPNGDSAKKGDQERSATVTGASGKPEVNSTSIRGTGFKQVHAEPNGSSESEEKKGPLVGVEASSESTSTATGAAATSNSASTTDAQATASEGGGDRQLVPSQSSSANASDTTLGEELKMTDEPEEMAVGS
jgi:hypothetical protein